MSKFNIGDKVKYIGTKHNINPQWFPIVGTIGTVVQDVDEVDCYIQWPKGSTSKEDCWYCNKNDIELVENVDMTNEEIWEMLWPKMEQKGLKKKMGGLYIGKNLVNGFWVYEANDVHNAIALAYKVGYLRSQKGRPFKIGEKKEKKGGHWEPVDPKNLPKEGTKVRYSRPICFEDEFYLIGWNVGDEGIVNYHGNYFGVKREGKNWDGVGMFGYYFDMWVEDDE